MASVNQPVQDPVAALPTRLYRVTYVDIVVRETFVSAHDESEAGDIVEGQINEVAHHHAIDAYHDDVQAEPVTEIGRRTTCFECGHTTAPDLSAAR